MSIHNNSKVYYLAIAEWIFQTIESEREREGMGIAVLGLFVCSLVVETGLRSAAASGGIDSKSELRMPGYLYIRATGRCTPQ